MFKYVLLIVLSIIALTNAGYTCPKPCYGNMCCSPSPNNEYYLTDFCGSTSACGPTPYCTGTHYFTADSQRFGCGKYLNLCKDSSRCVKAQIIDAGPALWVEQDAGRAIIDASPTICSYLYDSSSCGWSDHFSITAVLTSLDDSRPLGPFNVSSAEEWEQMMITHEIMMNQCEADSTCGKPVEINMQ